MSNMPRRVIPTSIPSCSSTNWTSSRSIRLQSVQTARRKAVSVIEDVMSSQARIPMKPGQQMYGFRACVQCDGTCTSCWLLGISISSLLTYQVLTRIHRYATRQAKAHGRVRNTLLSSRRLFAISADCFPRTLFRESQYYLTVQATWLPSWNTPSIRKRACRDLA